MCSVVFTEQQFIDWVTAGPRAALPVGPGDDCALLHDGTVIGLDTVVEGVHFAPGTDLARVARKALGACLSDVCAMGAVAESVLVSAQLPPGLDGRALADGLALWAARFAVSIAGGDTVSTAPGALALAVTACGRLPPGAQPWRRAGAQLGDLLVVSGPLGGSRGGRHLDVRPRADTVAWIRCHDCTVHAAIDLSDGLAADLPRLTEASGVGARVQAAAVPIHADARALPSPLTAALGDGEDFELLLALAPDSLLPPQSSCIGQITASGLELVGEGGRAGAWPQAGYAHAF